MVSGILTLSEAIARSKHDPKFMRHIVATCYERIEQYNNQYNVFIKTYPHPTADSSYHGKLLGAPVAIKDLFHLRGELTTAGSKIFKDQIAEESAIVVEKLISNGAHIIGKTNTHEIALGVTGTNPHFGDVPNPWDRERIIGGSSSGSAAAVVLGMCLAAMGTDTGGSIRIPASLSGIVGLKPTFGRVSTKGIVPLSWNLDHPGPLTRSVADAAIILELISGHIPTDPYIVDRPVDDYSADLEKGVEGLKIGLLAGEFFTYAESEVQQSIIEAAKIFRSLGAVVDFIEMDFLSAAATANTNMLKTDAAAYHFDNIEKQPELFGDDIRVRLLEGRDFPATSYALARRTQTEMIHMMRHFFTDHDALILPTTPSVAPKINNTDPLKQAKALNKFTAPFNLCGVPAISIPCGFSDNGLPIGMQIVTSHWEEKKLFQIANAYEKFTDWGTYLPQV